MGISRLWGARCGILTAFSNVTNIKNTFFWYAFLRKRLLQQLRRFQNIFRRQNPRSPVDTECVLTFRIYKDVDAVEWIGVHGGHDISGPIRAYGNESEVEGSAEVTNLLECWAVRKFVFGVIVVDLTWKLGNCPIPRITGTASSLSATSIEELW